MCPHSPEADGFLLKKPFSGDWWRETREAEPVDRSQVPVMPLMNWSAEEAGDPAPGQQRATGASQHFMFYVHVLNSLLSHPIC